MTISQQAITSPKHATIIDAKKKIIFMLNYAVG